MITIKHSGSFNNTEKFLKDVVTADYMHILEKYGRIGVTALAQATPVDTGETANSWGYEIKCDRRGPRLVFTNSNIVDGVPVAVLIQYGHATGNGGYIEGRDFINPVLQPIFDQIANDLWGEVSKL